jgi:hypothetical protein
MDSLEGRCKLEIGVRMNEPRTQKSLECFSLLERKTLRPFLLVLLLECECYEA